MTRDQLIETMARAIGRQDGIPDELWSASEPHATAALTALEAAGMRVVPVERIAALDAALRLAVSTFEDAGFSSRDIVLLRARAALAAQEDSTSE